MSNSPQTPKVSVVIPCYNVEDHLTRALESVLVQTYRDFCFYAVDDGSTDQTGAILRRYSGRGVCASQAHAGQGAARNRGIRMSNSPFVAFQDADDEWFPEKLERQMDIMEGDPEIGLLCSGCLPSAGQATRAPGAMTEVRFRELLTDCLIYTPTVVVRRKCLQQVGLFDESLAVSEDFNLWLRIAARWRVVFLSEPLAMRHQRPTSLSLTVGDEMRLRSSVAALQSVRARCPAMRTEDSRHLRRALAARYYTLGAHLFSIGAHKECRRELLSAWIRRPSDWRAFAKLGLSFFPAGAVRSLLREARKLRGAEHSAPV